MGTLVLDSIKIDVNNQGENVISLISGEQNILGTLSFEQVQTLHEAIEDILDPKRRLKLQLKNLKLFKRQVYTHYKQATDPEVKAQKLQLYIETKNLINDLEQGV